MFEERKVRALEADVTAEEVRLREENEALKRQLAQLRKTSANTGVNVWYPSSYTIWAIVLGVVILVVVGFLAGFIPLRKRQSLIGNEALEQAQSLPRAEVIKVSRASRHSDLELPGNIQAITEAPILSRADGYIKRRMVDIGDRVKAGQPLAEMEAPELDEQIRQSKANLEQAKASLEEALANQEQGKANLEMSRVTSQRWNNLVGRGVVSKQDNDLYQTQFQSQAASVHSLERAAAAQRSSVSAAEANVARLEQMGSYRIVRAPFDGVVTQRNVDVGALVNTGTTLLFRIAQTGTLRTYVNVPQTSASSVRAGQPARLRIASLPNRSFTATVARTANSLDPSSRTMLVELHVPNAEGLLMPGMYAQVNLGSVRASPPILIPSAALIVLPDGTEVATVTADHTVHLKRIELGRDFGDKLEVISGLEEGDSIMPNPGDLAREGIKVR